MKKATKRLLLALLLAATGCAVEKDPVKYSENEQNGLRKTITAGPLIYTIQYKPAAYITRMEHLDQAAAGERKKQLEGMAWFNITFRVKDYNQSPLRYNIKGMEEYVQRQDYYLNAAPADMYLLYGKDTLYVNSYWFENNQNLAAHETIIVGFKLPGAELQPEKDLRFSFYDRVYKNGILKTVIRKEDLEEIPEL